MMKPTNSGAVELKQDPNIFPATGGDCPQCVAVDADDECANVKKPVVSGGGLSRDAPVPDSLGQRRQESSRLRGVEPLGHAPDIPMPSGALRRILVTASQFTDDALGRVLEDLADHGPALLATLGAPMQAVEHAGPRVLHAGTTAFALFSDYPDATGPSAPVQITYGHSKDHRSDLRQIMMGLTVDDDGQVVGSIMLSGNTSDRQWHPGGFLA